MILLVGVVLALFVFPDGYEIPAIAGFALLEVVETAITWRLSRRWAPRFGPETLIGARGRTISALRPTGLVRVHSEQWQGRCDAGMDPDEPIRVVERDGLVLIVEPDLSESRPAAPSRGARAPRQG